MAMRHLLSESSRAAARGRRPTGPVLPLTCVSQRTPRLCPGQGRARRPLRTKARLRKGCAGWVRMHGLNRATRVAGEGVPTACTTIEEVGSTGVGALTVGFIIFAVCAVVFLAKANTSGEQRKCVSACRVGGGNSVPGGA